MFSRRPITIGATLAGALISGFFAPAKGLMSDAIRNEEREGRLQQRRLRRRLTGRDYKPAGPDSREAKRRVRQGVFHAQHPSVFARFAALDARAREAKRLAAELEAMGRETRQVGGVKGVVSQALTRLNPLRRVEGETKRERDARVKRERRAALTLETTA